MFKSILFAAAAALAISAPSYAGTKSQASAGSAVNSSGSSVSFGTGFQAAAGGATNTSLAVTSGLKLGPITSTTAATNSTGVNGNVNGGVGFGSSSSNSGQQGEAFAKTKVRRH